ncbi:hypothetical protein Tco_0849407 [Tanacetum coccineum]
MLILVGLGSHFTYNTTLSVSVEVNQKQIFLQDRHESVVFILHQEVQQHGRAFYVDCVGLSTLKDMLLYHLTAQSMDMETYVTMKFVPEVTMGFSLSVCIIKDDLGLHDRDAHKVLKVVLNEPYVLDCSICLEPLWTLVFQHAPHAAPSSRVSVHVTVTTISVVEVLRRSSNQSVKYHANMLNMVMKRQSLTMKRSSTKKIVHVPPHAFALTHHHVPIPVLTRICAFTLGSNMQLTSPDSPTELPFLSV